jgi:pSer/pThr/pTyr-binding forkhead associated (FHA) protein
MLMAKLVVISEEMKDRNFELSDDRVTVGRLQDNIICLDDGAISSHHAELSKKGEDYVVRDLNSTNGTRVNGQRIVETRLYHGDAVAFGHIQLQYFSSSKSAPQPLPSPLKKTVDLTFCKSAKIK